MDDLDDKIRYENENSGLDFKEIQYKKETHEDLIKDIMCMANADIDGDRYIIIGVDYKSSNDRDFVGIKKEEFIDSATYQQLIKDNIEPEINIDYFAYDLDGVCLGIFKLVQCSNKPYMMKKDFGKKLNKGDCWIRKGSSQFRMIREDFDKIIAKRISRNNLMVRLRYISAITLKTRKSHYWRQMIYSFLQKGQQTKFGILSKEKKVPPTGR